MVEPFGQFGQQRNGKAIREILTVMFEAVAGKTISLSIETEVLATMVSEWPAVEVTGVSSVTELVLDVKARLPPIDSAPAVRSIAPALAVMVLDMVIVSPAVAVSASNSIAELAKVMSPVFEVDACEKEVMLIKGRLLGSYRQSNSVDRLGKQITIGVAAG